MDWESDYSTTAAGWRVCLTLPTTAPTDVGDTYAPTTPAPTAWPTSAAQTDWVWVATVGGDTTGCGHRGNPCQTINYALSIVLNLADKGTVLVTAGVHGVPQEGIFFGGYNIMIRGEPGAVVDCRGSPYGFKATSNEPSTAVIRSDDC